MEIFHQPEYESAMDRAERRRKEREEKEEQEQMLRSQQREDLRKENSDAAQEWYLRFASQWGLLSGGTLTLLVTFAQAHHTASYCLFQISSILLLISLLSSGLQFFFGGQSFHHAAKYLSGAWVRNSQVGETVWQRLYVLARYISIGSYVLAVILAWVFIDSNLR